MYCSSLGFIDLGFMRGHALHLGLYVLQFRLADTAADHRKAVLIIAALRVLGLGIRNLQLHARLRLGLNVRWQLSYAGEVHALRSK